jgi:hypothetical protein
MFRHTIRPQRWLWMIDCEWPIVLKPGAAEQRSVQDSPILTSELDELFLSWLGSIEMDRKELNRLTIERAALDSIGLAGAAYLSAVSICYGIETKVNFAASIGNNDWRRLSVIYPDFDALQDDSAECARIRSNNMGTFIVYTASGSTSCDELSKLLLESKVTFRVAMSELRNGRPKGDHLVHIPDSRSEIIGHLRVLEQFRVNV